MQKLQLPFIHLPGEYVELLTSNLSVTSSPASIFDKIRPNRGLYTVLERAFREFDDGRGLEKLFTTLGWPSFRDRVASIYIHKSLHGDYPSKTDMELVEEIKQLESRFADQGVHSLSRVFLLGFYLKLANIETQRRENNHFLEIKVPEETEQVLRLSQGRSEKLDWLILTVWHISHSLGGKMVMNALLSGKKFEDLYSLMSPDARENMHQNLLSYAASIREADVFLYEKI